MSPPSTEALDPFEPLDFDSLPEEPRRPHPYFEIESRRLEVETSEFGSIETHLKVCGEGPPLLLIHGLMTSSYSWRYVLEPLGEHYRLYIPDLPGAGQSDKPLDASYDSRGLADWIAALIDRLDIRCTSMIGNSLGGYLGMWLALRHSDRLRALVNLHSPGLPTLRLRALGWGLALPGLDRGLAWWVRRHPQRWAHEHVHYRDESLKSREEARVYGEPLSTFEGSRAFVRYLDEAMDAVVLAAFENELRSRRERGESFPIPLHMIYADEDPMVPPEIGDRLAELVPDARFDRIEEASHFAHVDAPERFVEMALAFLEETR